MAEPDTDTVGNSQTLPLATWADLIAEVRLVRQKTAARVARSEAIRGMTVALIDESRAARAACQESRMKARGLTAWPMAIWSSRSAAT
jgi:hypothetical protein